MLIQLPGSAAEWEAWRVTVNGEVRPVSLRRLAGVARCVCEWPQSGAGRYRVVLEHPGHGIATHEFSLAPAKLREGAFERLVQDLERHLPHALAAALQRGGALAGLVFRPPENVSPATELARLRHLLKGGEGAPGLLPLLRRIACDPHRLLEEVEIVVPQGRARRPHPVLLRQDLYRSRQIDDEGRPLWLRDRRVEPSFDTYENRFLKLIAETLRQRLVRLLPLLPDALRAEAEGWIEELDRARRRADFLDEVRLPTAPPTTVTQVLVRRPDYRRAVELWRALSSGLEVRLDAAELATPLQSVPALYELWASLSVLAEIVAVLVERGFRIAAQRLVRRLPEGPLVKLASSQDPVLTATHADGTGVRIHFQRSFVREGAPFASRGFEQRPDLVIETLRPDGIAELLILDPKYKVEERSGELAPKKEDIDKMHAYRDAIIHRAQGRVVRRAAILYPGPARDFDGVVWAVPAEPLTPEVFRRAIRQLVVQ